MNAPSQPQRLPLPDWLLPASLPVIERARGLFQRGVALRKRVGGAITINAYNNLARVSGALPHARPERHGLERITNIPYTSTGLPAHTLDVYRKTSVQGALPILFYVHGGGFRGLSKDTHWLMGLAFARRGFLVFNVNYRLAPEHPFPAGLTDVCEAYRFVVREAARFGGDPERVLVAGESAGANLITSLIIAACYPRPEPFARAVFEAGAVPRAALAACGLFQVSDGERFQRKHGFGWYFNDRYTEIAEMYLKGADAGSHDLADPLVFLERGERPARPLPPFFLPVGGADHLYDDTERMQAALTALGIDCEARIYPGEIHAFHAFLWRKAARDCWRDHFSFLRRRSLDPRP